MSQPTPYDRQFSFQDWQSTRPTTPLPADKVDLELNAVKITLDETLTNLALIQRDDGALKNGIVTNESLAPSLSIGFTFRGLWASPVNYLARDGVSYGNQFYLAKVSHTSSGSNRPDLDPATWELGADFSSAIGAIGGTSTTSNTIGTGNKTFTTQADKAFTAGSYVTVASSSSPNNFMAGQVVSYSGTTIIVNVVTVGGSGTFAAWNIALSGIPGANGANGATGATGATGPAGADGPLSSAAYTVNTFVAGVGFTAGSTTQLTCTASPASAQSTFIFFDGVRQDSTRYSVAGAVVTFTVAIPVGVTRVEICFVNAVQAVSVVADGTITEPKLGAASVSETKLVDGAVVLSGNKTSGVLPVSRGGTNLTALESTVASASTVDLGAEVAPVVNITGTTTITSFGTAAAGTRRIIRFGGALTLTHNGTSLILPGGANITTAAGDMAEAHSLGSGNWRVDFFNRAAGLPFTRSFASADQTITAGGSLTLAHGLGVVPKLVVYELVCQSTDGGYSAGDIIDSFTWDFSETTNALAGFSCVKDATNLNVRFATRSQWPIPNKGTGAIANITFSNWRMRFNAYA